MDEINLESFSIHKNPTSATSALSYLWWCWVCLVLAVTVMVLYIIPRCSGAGTFLFSADCTLILPHPPCLVFFFLHTMRWNNPLISLRLLLLSLLQPECSFEYLILALCHNVERLNDFSCDWSHFSRLGWRHYLLLPWRQEEEQVRTIWSVKFFLWLTFSGDSASLNMKVIRLQVSQRGIAFKWYWSGYYLFTQGQEVT